MRNSFLPGTDSGLLAWARNFSEKINASPALWGISPQQAADFAALAQSYSDTYRLAIDPITRTQSAVAGKNASRKSLKTGAALLASIIQGQASVTDAQKIDLGLTVRSTPTAQPAPEGAPAVNILSIQGRTARIRLKNMENFGSRARPRGVDGAIIFAAVSEQSPESAEPVFIALTNKTTLDVTLPLSAAPGAQVWIVARWFNRRKQMGPNSNPVCTNIQFGGIRMAA
jgi:hypothetical protein